MGFHETLGQNVDPCFHLQHAFDKIKTLKFEGKLQNTRFIFLKITFLYFKVQKTKLGFDNKSHI